MVSPLWVFGYGSLLWDPGFEPAEICPARLHGWHRSFSMISIHYRGTAEVPGLVLALDERAGAVCDGLAMRVRDEEAETVLAALRARELVSDAYLERHFEVIGPEERALDVVTYVIDPEGPQYCDLALEEQAQMIAEAVGARGPNRDYLENTHAHLCSLGVEDPDLGWLVKRVREING
jgi:cation transport protein ChaC